MARLGRKGRGLGGGGGRPRGPARRGPAARRPSASPGGDRRRRYESGSRKAADHIRLSDKRLKYRKFSCVSRVSDSRPPIFYFAALQDIHLMACKFWSRLPFGL